MPEKKIVIEELKIEYDGLVEIAELYKFIDRWLKDKQYDKMEIKNFEQAGADGKYVELDLKPYKTLTDYVKFELRIRVRGYNLKDVDVEKDGKKVRMQQGRVLIILDAYFVTDHMKRWESSPYWFFLRTLFDKYVYRSSLTRQEAHLLEDVSQLQGKLKAFLNLYRY